VDALCKHTEPAVTLDCKVETISTTLYLFWYRQEMGDFPKYLWNSYVGISENAPGISGDRFKATRNGTSVPLKIQKLQLTDSAVYYCALRPTKTTQYSTTFTRGSHTLINFYGQHFFIFLYSGLITDFFPQLFLSSCFKSDIYFYPCTGYVHFLYKSIFNYTV
uniref:Ig-like domain-containing protein n=1 Tax=Labrus bergylta TaxID=56723 RepID=A0A3Q3H3J7_9LABR